MYDVHVYRLCFRSRRLKKRNATPSDDDPPLAATAAPVNSSLTHSSRGTDTAGYGSTHRSLSSFDTPRSYSPESARSGSGNTRGGSGNSPLRDATVSASIHASLDERMRNKDRHVTNPIFSEFTPSGSEPPPDYPRQYELRRSPNKQTQVGFSGAGIAFRNHGYDSSSDHGSSQGSNNDQHFYNL